MAEKDFFISYNKADQQWAEWIAWQLEATGYATVIQAWDFGAGSDFVEEMNQAAIKAARTIAVLSNNYLKSEFCKAEWHAAFADDPTGKLRKLIPVRVRECDPEGLLKVRNYVDLVGKDEAAAKEILLAKIKGERGKPTNPIPFPSASHSSSATEKPNFPGALPPVWNVPHRENPHFVGRDELLDQMRETLNAGQAAALTAIHGLGGVGKTQLAAHYAHRHKGDYQIIWWIKAEETATLASDYAALATALDLPEKDAREQPVIVTAVRRWLEQHPDWLLIFDNARDAEVVREYLPQGRAGHALITSRDPNWRGVALPLEVRTLLREDAARFLLERTGQSDVEAARALAAELGDLPLALEQAGAYIEETGETIARYTELFRARRQELQREERPPAGYPDTVATTWLLSFQQAAEQTPAAADLLRLCAFLAPDDIPLSVLVAGAEHLPAALAAAVADQLVCNRTIAALRRYSLITRQDDSLSMHRLVQLVTRDRLTEDERRQWAEAAIRVVNQAFPDKSQDVRTWPVCTRLLSHTLAVAEEGEVLQVDPEATSRLINQTGTFLHSRARYAEAKQSFERALRILEAHLGKDDPKVGILVNNLGGALQAIGDLASAWACYERALRIDEAAFGSNHPSVARDINNLGSVLEALGDLAGARAHYERALRIDETAFGSDDPNVADRVNNLGGVLESLGDLTGARVCYERALRIDEAAFVPDHPNVARDLNNLGSVLEALGDVEGARNCCEHALRIFTASLGEDHPYTVKVRNNLKSLG